MHIFFVVFIVFLGSVYHSYFCVSFFCVVVFAFFALVYSFVYSCCVLYASCVTLSWISSFCMCHCILLHFSVVFLVVFCIILFLSFVFFHADSMPLAVRIRASWLMVNLQNVNCYSINEENEFKSSQVGSECWKGNLMILRKS